MNINRQLVSSFFAKSRKVLVVWSLAVLLSQSAMTYATPPSSTSVDATQAMVTSDQADHKLRVYGVSPQSDAVKQLMASFDDLLQASNKHSLNDIIKHYSPKFISGDNFNLAQLKQMIKETWEAYPDIKYESSPIEIRMSGDWATIETLDKAIASSPPDKEIMSNTPGKMISESRSRLFFKRNGTIWEITSDATLWEQAKILYGIDEDTKLVLSAPDQVKAGDAYSAIIETDLPAGTFMIGTISNDAIKFPQPKTEGKFRTLDGGSDQLQRVLTSNSENRNEIVTATLGVTNIYQKYQQERPGMSINGIATIVKRVNVIPISNDDMVQAMKKQQLVNTSASGTVVVDPNKPAAEDKGN